MVIDKREELKSETYKGHSIEFVKTIESFGIPDRSITRVRFSIDKSIVYDSFISNNKEKAFELAKKFIDKMENKSSDKQIIWGFDLTQFSSGKDFQKLLDRHNLKKFRKFDPYYNDKGYRGITKYYEWSNSKLKIITNYNAINGESSDRYKKGGPENIGFTGYIGIEGDKDKVIALTKDIKNTAEYIKDESPYKRDYI